jgi:hypothetical protein
LHRHSFGSGNEFVGLPSRPQAEAAPVHSRSYGHLSTHLEVEPTPEMLPLAHPMCVGILGKTMGLGRSCVEKATIWKIRQWSAAAGASEICPEDLHDSLRIGVASSIRNQSLRSQYPIPRTNSHRVAGFFLNNRTCQAV